ncbi:MAG: DUF4221 domain-containing protein [Dysgonamonadaceae bacterium]|jgi:hypothetical protein|nr:DUF4221 domain-containing protein [Dysgonamonadaceae bacterium]
MKSKIVSYIIFVLLVSCTHHNNKTQDRKGRSIYTMRQVEYKRFPLDENTTQNTNYTQMCIINGKVCFSLFNPAKYNILVYDFDAETLIDSIQLFKEGPDNVGNAAQGFLICSIDSIYVYDQWLGMIYQVNHKGNVVKKIDIGKKIVQSNIDCTIAPVIFPQTNSPIDIVNGNLILQGMSGNIRDCERPVCTTTLLYNFKNDVVSLINPYPEIYGEHKNIREKWGTFSYRQTHYTLDKKRTKMIVDFPADDCIIIYDLKTGGYERIFAGYSVKDVIKVADIKTRASIDEQYYGQTQYVGIYYDEYNDLYYRLVLHPLNDYDLSNRETLAKKASVIILDSNFRKVGEYDVPERLQGRYAKTFVSKDGLHINCLSEDDDYLKFITLNPVKL